MYLFSQGKATMRTEGRLVSGVKWSLIELWARLHNRCISGVYKGKLSNQHIKKYCFLTD